MYSKVEAAVSAHYSTSEMNRWTHTLSIDVTVDFNNSNV
jgi:hypothetical protein